MITPTTLIKDLTVSEFLYLLEKDRKPVVEGQKKWLVYGLKGIGELFNCSIQQALKIKKSGVIDKAITQIGRKIVVDADKALELINKSKK